MSTMNIENINSTGVNNEDLTVTVKFNGTLDSNDNVEFRVIIDGNKDINLSLSSDKFYRVLEDNNNTYTFTIKNYINTSDVSFVVDGIQRLNDGAYFYEAKDGWKKAQSYVSYEFGSTAPINISIDIISGNLVLNKTDGTQSLVGAEFELRNINDTTVVYKATSTG